MNQWYNASMDIKGIPLTRYVASWYVAGGLRYRPMIVKWLNSLIINGESLTNEEIDIIADCACNGKLELEDNARKFIKEKMPQVLLDDLD